MRKQVRDKMLAEYFALPIKGKGTCSKYIYKYNNIFVNIYFDAFDEECYSLSLILSVDNQFYFTTLNIMNTNIRKEYLPELPSIFLDKIVVNGSLDKFYYDMEEKILNTKSIALSYKKDVIFTNTTNFQKSEIDLPFWWHIRKARMTDTTVEELCERADISRETLKKIQEKGWTLVRTADSSKRSKLNLILDKDKIEL